MNTFRLFLLSPLGELMLRWTVLFSFAWMANAVMRRSHPRRRLILWRGVLVLGCLLPFVSFAPIKVFRIDGEAALALGLEPTKSAGAIQPTAIVGFPLDSSPTLRAAEGLLTEKSWPTLVALVWLVGSITGAIRLLLLQVRLARLRRNSREAGSELLVVARDVQARLGVRQTVTVRISDEVTSPFIRGLLHPAIILPAELLRTLAPVQIPALLTHEMAHLRSQDLTWCVGWRWMKTLGWLHPLIWRAPAAHNLACEQEADRIASDQWADRSLYTRLLAQLTLRVMRLPAVETTLAMNGASQIVKRLALLRRDRFHSWRWTDSFTGFGLVAGLALVTMGWGFSTARAENTPDKIAQRLAEQNQPRTVVPFDPKQFDKYIGFYQMEPTVFFTITRKGDHFFSRLTGQSDVEVYPESPTKFFAKVVAAQLNFVTNAEGNTIELVLHQGGEEQHALKVDESVKKNAEAALAERIKNNTPDPDREPPLRRNIEGLIKGQPDLDDMAPGLIAATNQQWPAIQKDFGGVGALKSLVFKNVGPQGMDVYLATFENRKIEFLIGPLTSDHKMHWLFMRPAPDAAAMERIKNKTPDRDREPPLRRFIDALIKGQPNLDDMGPGLIAATYQQWPMIQKSFQGVGALKSLVFKNVDPQGMDVYIGTFENREIEFLIGPLTSDHKMEGLLLRPAQ
jgi:beta-lactamase regulating signal transducer with metallopeptidase domain